MAAGHLEALERFGALYEKSLYKAVHKLSGISDKELEETLVIAILLDIWRYRIQLYKDPRASILIYKFIVHRVFKALDKMGKQDQIEYLKRLGPMPMSAYQEFPFKNEHPI
jgi:hypothetical protein